MLQKFMITLLTLTRFNNVLVLIIKFSHLHNDSIEYKSNDSPRTIQFNNTKDLMSNSNNLNTFRISTKRKRRRFNLEVSHFKCNQLKLYNCNHMIINSWPIVILKWWVVKIRKIMNLNSMLIKKWTEAVLMFKLITWMIKNSPSNTWNASVVTNYQKSHSIAKLVEQSFVKTVFINYQVKPSSVHAVRRNFLSDLR